MLKGENERGRAKDDVKVGDDDKIGMPEEAGGNSGEAIGDERRDVEEAIDPESERSRFDS